MQVTLSAALQAHLTRSVLKDVDMIDVLKNFWNLLKLEKIEETLFRGISEDLGLGSAVYGGQILGQALSAASQTVTSGRSAHSCHSYFMRSGDLNIPIIYKVESLHEGKTLTLKKVTAYQNEKPIFFMNVSFHIQEDGFEHQSAMKNVAPPEKIPSVLDLFRAVKDTIPESIREQLTCDKPIDYKIIDPMNIFELKEMPPEVNIWFKAVDTLPYDLAMYQCMLAYASDFGVMSASLNPHARSMLEPTIQATSIDHALWFHRDFRMDEWLLHCIESTNAHNGRVLNRGNMYTQDGVLVASFVQEGLVRNSVS